MADLDLLWGTETCWRSFKNCIARDIGDELADGSRPAGKNTVGLILPSTPAHGTERPWRAAHIVQLVWGLLQESPNRGGCHLNGGCLAPMESVGAS